MHFLRRKEAEIRKEAEMRRVGVSSGVSEASYIHDAMTLAYIERSR